MNPVALGPDPAYQARQDNEQLNLLTIFYYIVAGITALFGLMGLFHVLMGLMFVGASSTTTIAVNPNTFPGAPPLPAPLPGSGHPPNGAPPPAIGWMFVLMGAAFLVGMEALALFTFLAGRSVARRQNKTLIQIVAGILCLNMPLGTALGVFTFIVLSRSSIAALFDAPRSS